MGGEEDTAGDSESQSEDVKDMQDTWGVCADIGAGDAILIADRNISALA